MFFCFRLCFCFVEGWFFLKDADRGIVYFYFRGVYIGLVVCWVLLRKDGDEGS